MIPGLIKDLTSQNEVVRLDAVETLSELGNEATSAIPSLINMLHDKDPLVRGTTALALAGFGAKAAPAVPELIKLLGDQNRRVREGASLALENIGQDAVGPLMQVLKKGEGPGVDLAIQALSRIGKAAEPQLLTASYPKIRKQPKRRLWP